MTNTLFVSHYGDDRNNCHNWTTPCRTVRNAVKMANEGDRIFIDYANGSPYMECQNLTQTRYSMGLTKSVSFYGINGKAEIRCSKQYDLFNITSPTGKITRVKFVNLIISKSVAAVQLNLKTRSEIVFQNVIVKNNIYGINSKYSLDCSILIVNSTFEYNFPKGIRLQCFRVNAQIVSSFFRVTRALFSNIGYKPPRWQSMRIWVRNTLVDGDYTQMCVDLFAIQAMPATLNVTITNSQFKNHIAICGPTKKYSALHIYNHNSDSHIISSSIFLSSLSIENNYNNWFTLALDAFYLNFTKVKIMIKDTIFKNNSAALYLSPHFRNVRKRFMPTIHVKNNTFVDNMYEQVTPNGAAAIYFSSGKSKVTACRFLDNKAGKNSYVGVVTVSTEAIVTFLNSFFENRQTKVQSNQFFAVGKQPLRFLGKNTVNLVALKTGQPVFIRIPTALNTGVRLGKNFKILCPQGYKLNPEQLCNAIKTGNLCLYLNVQCEQCPTKTYTVERGTLISNKSNNIQCHQCPQGGDCDSGLVKARPNFWGYKTEMKVRFVQCPSGYCCDSPKGCATYNGCQGNRYGTLCGHCLQGMSEGLFSTQCIPNTECSTTYFFILGMIALLVLYLVFFLYNAEILTCIKMIFFGRRLPSSTNRRNRRESNSNRDDNDSPSSGGMMKIFFYYYQVCNLVRGCLGRSNRGGLISNIENAFSRLMNMILFNLPTFTCPFKNLRPVPKAIVLHSVGFCLLGFLGLLYFLRLLYLISKRIKKGYQRTAALQYVAARSQNARSSSESSFSERIVSAFTHISLLMYASSAQLSLSLLFCVPVDKDKVLFLDGNIKCYQPFQYFLLAYMISSIIPFYMVPFLGSYVLKFGQIGVKQFCAAVLFPLPFCGYWMYLLFRGCRNQERIHQINDLDTDEDNSDAEITFDHTEGDHTTLKGSASAILTVLSGPFRSHKAYMCFPASRIPWEGFLIFRRLALILVLTFVYDIQLRLFLALTLCVAILIVHTLVYPFQKKRDNILESFSLGTHVILCGLALVKAFYYGEDYSFSKSQPALNVIENVFVIAPLSVVLIFVAFYIIMKLASGLKACSFGSIRIIKRLITT